MTGGILHLLGSLIAKDLAEIQKDGIEPRIGKAEVNILSNTQTIHLPK